MAVEKAQSPHKKAVGNNGESLALAYLVTLGYRVVDTNIRPLPGMARGEIDIIAWEEDVLCFIEVKTRRSLKADPAEAIDIRKQRQLVTLAEAYIALHDLDDVPCRFDVITVRNARLPQPTLRLIRDAFQPE
jgi:putative endonuclease